MRPTTTEAPPPDTAAPETTEAAPETTEAPLDDLEPIGQGPYDVGVQTITINAESERPLTVDVWFPIDDAGDAPLHQYTLIPGAFDTSDLAVAASPSAIAEGPFPLVIYSHGSGGLRYIASNYTETIASHGYIVASADHTGNTALDYTALHPNRRPRHRAEPHRRRPLDRRRDAQSAERDHRPVRREHRSGKHRRHRPLRRRLHHFRVAASGYENDLGSVAADERIGAIIPISPAIGGDRPPLDDAHRHDSSRARRSM